MRDEISAAMSTAMREQNAARLATLRLISAAIKDRDIAARGQRGREDGDDDAQADDAEILGLLGKMIRQREESARLYEEGGRLELAERERFEISVIWEFLPSQLTMDELRRAVADAVRQSGAGGIRDMGKAMAVLKNHYAGRVDFAAAANLVKAALTDGGE